MKLYVDRSRFKFSSEMIVLAGLLDELPKEGPENEGRFGDAIQACRDCFQYVNNVDDADVVVVPHKFNGWLPAADKQVWCFYNDDNSMTFDIPPNVTLFRTSMYASKKLPNERAMPTFSPDYFDGTYIDSGKISIGFCGHPNNGRKEHLATLMRSDIKTDFIIRKGFWAPGIDKVVARREYFDNIRRTVFNFCYRGAGNFSYRLYETLMMGRIPVLVDTDCVFPIDVKPHCVYCLPGDDIVEKIQEFVREKDIMEIQRSNRRIWDDQLSPIQFINNISRIS